ncbi:MAG: HEPN domain-containing protein [Chitinivibrionales bacterium]|nr:HEPN domain-containing protein [Chitinivibrionales bacterium]
MATEKTKQEALRWLRAARDDLKTAAILHDAAQYAHSCFHAQQAAEKALKSILYHHDQDPWGHSAAKLLDELQRQGFLSLPKDATLHDRALVLDRFYVPTLYPNGLPDLSPDEAYSSADSSAAVGYAREFLTLAEEALGQASG